jgi:hypothetical protein
VPSASTGPVTEHAGKRPRKQFEAGPIASTNGYLPGGPQSLDTLTALQQLNALFSCHVEAVSSLESQSRAQRRAANNAAKAAQECTRIVASVAKWVCSQMCAFAENFKRGRTSDASEPGLALPIILKFLHKLLYLSQRLHAGNCERLLEAFTSLFCEAPVRSAAKLHCVHFIVDFLCRSTHTNSSGDRLCHLQLGDAGVPVAAVTIQAWLTVFPKMLWSLGPAHLDLSMSCIDILREEARRATPSSASGAFLKQIVRFLAPLLYSVKSAEADNSRTGTFGPFVGYPPSLQFALLDFLASVGGMTPALKRSLIAVCADGRTSISVRAAVINAAIRMVQMDVLQGTPVLATVAAGMLSAYAVESVAFILSLCWCTNIEASASLNGNRFTLHTEPSHLPAATAPTSDVIADWQLALIKHSARQVEALLSLLPVDEAAVLATDVQAISYDALRYAGQLTSPFPHLKFVALWMASLQTRRPDIHDHMSQLAQTSDALVKALCVFASHNVKSVVDVSIGRTSVLHPGVLLLPSCLGEASLINSGMRALSLGIVGDQPKLVLHLVDTLLQLSSTRAALHELDDYANLLISVLRHPSLWRKLKGDGSLVTALVQLKDAISPATLASRPQSDLSAVISRLYQELHAVATI